MKLEVDPDLEAAGPCGIRPVNREARLIDKDKDKEIKMFIFLFVQITIVAWANKS
jgi:hypothetical protein